MTRLTTIAFVTCIALLLLLYHYHERLSIATSLVATFIKFPNSRMTIISIDDRIKRQERQDKGALAKTTICNETQSPLEVPSIIHQVKLGGLAMRPSWTEARISCQKLHPSWTFLLWEDEDANNFVKQYYPQLYSTYRGYPLEIQRSNVIRYLLLDHYGGMYLDLDLNCHQRLDFLRNETFLSPPANPTGVNNAFLVSTKGNPFWSHLIASLPRYNLDWHTPYLTNMFSTGCHFFSTMHRTYPQQSSLKILDSTQKLNGHVSTLLFEHMGSSSWHKGDAKLVLRLGKMIENLKGGSGIIISFLTFAVIAVFCGVIVSSLLLRRRRLNISERQERKQRLDLESSKLG